INLNNKPSFTDKFLTKLLENGFDFMKEKELKVYILYLLLEDGQFVNNNGYIDYHEISLVLKISETKVRNLVYEVELKYRANHNFIEQLISIIKKGKYEVTDGKVKFAVHNPLVKQYFEYEIRQLDGVSDGSFAKHIVSISTTTFEKLLLKLYGNSTKAGDIISELPDSLKENITDKDSLIKEFVREFGKSFSSTSGERSANLLFDVIDPASLLKRLFGNG
ncbi:MAG: hypothetical protein QG565_32, partial [Campylobacterota bacterium]|nr:hypothetical protein [Campylobacterota bacterium]